MMETHANAGDRDRTGTGGKSRRILSPVRLPVPPLRHSSISHILQLNYLKICNNLLLQNGTNRARTYDPLLVRQMLSQLS